MLGLLLVVLGLLLVVLCLLLIVLGLLLLLGLLRRFGVIGLPLLLRMLGLGPALLVASLLLVGMILLVAALLMLSEGWSRDSEEQGEDSGAGDSNYFHDLFPRGCPVQALLGRGFQKLAPLSQASGLRIDRVADCFTGHEKLHSPVLLPSRSVIVRRHGQAVAETPGRN